MKPKGGEPCKFPVYSDAICRALATIRRTQANEEGKLEMHERLELADALQVLALAANLESQITAHGGRLERDRGD